MAGLTDGQVVWQKGCIMTEPTKPRVESLPFRSRDGRVRILASIEPGTDTPALRREYQRMADSLSEFRMDSDPER